jgi:hypothetical protein
MESKKRFNIYSNNVKIAEVTAHTKWEAVDRYVNQNNLDRRCLNLKAK